MAAITVQTINDGLSTSTATANPTYAAATATTGDTFRNADGRTFLAVVNVGAEMIVTVNSVKKCNQGHDHDVAVTVAATTGVKWLGPFNPQDFNDANELVTVTYSRASDVTVAAFSLASAGR